MRQNNPLTMIAVYVILLGIFYIFPVTKAENTTIRFYHGSASDSYQLSEAEKILTNKNFKKSLPTVIFFHGYAGFVDTDDADTSKVLISAYNKNGGYNFLFLDWSELADDFYPIAVWHLERLGKEVAIFILKLVAEKYPIIKFHLLGHSLGAHLCGYVGRKIKSLSNNLQTLQRYVEGLDPAYPDFYKIKFRTRAISKTDAFFVDIIHTDAGLFGAPVETGTVDFWPNGGHSPQPGCGAISKKDSTYSEVNDVTGLVSCSHSRSVFLWAESVANKKKPSFTSRRKDDNKVKVQMGNNCPVNAQAGSYILKTNGKAPFSQG